MRPPPRHALCLPLLAALAPAVALGLRTGALAFPGNRKNRQVLLNFGDMQYYAHVTVGGQEITGLLDTGSFDLVTFDRSCSDCGQARGYASNQSRSFVSGSMQQTFWYGSGSVDVVEGFDKVAIGPFGEVNVTIWDGVQAFMPVLHKAAFQSVIGVGPPETPASDAWDEVKKLARNVNEEIDAGVGFPANSTYRELQKDTSLASELARQPTLIMAEGVSKFSICLGQKPFSNGFFIWNDTSYLEHPELFQRVQVLGRHTWTVNMTSFGLRGVEQPLSCENGCGAIIDSGTSLLMMPYAATEAILQSLQDSRISCDNLEGIPDLVFHLDGKPFSLPPEAYVAKMTGEEPQNMAEFGTVRKLRDDCELAVLASHSSTHWGPLWILGMPFFRKYYTSFEVGASRAERALFIAEADVTCNPAAAATLARMPRPEPQEMRTYDRSKMFLPQVARKAMVRGVVSV